MNEDLENLKKEKEALEEKTLQVVKAYKAALLEEAVNSLKKLVSSELTELGLFGLASKVTAAETIGSSFDLTLKLGDHIWVTKRSQTYITDIFLADVQLSTRGADGTFKCSFVTAYGQFKEYANKLRSECAEKLLFVENIEADTVSADPQAIFSLYTGRYK